MDKARDIGRRSFLTQVAGGAFAIGGFLAFGAANGAAQPAPGTATKKQDMLVDSDPGDPARTPGQPRPPRRVYRRALRRQTGPDASPMPAPSAPDRPRIEGRVGGPIQRFVVCPGNVRCPRRVP